MSLTIDDAIDTEVVDVVGIDIFAFGSAIDGLIEDLTSDLPDFCDDSEVGLLVSAEASALSKGVDDSETDVFALFSL